ncbi:MAG TPA: GNAT family N-acetyltransferase [Alphaproteobacteria bacterium]|nr:GNAT family N-acetyltransferase [Alphaproteobacteria bacterium]
MTDAVPPAAPAAPGARPVVVERVEERLRSADLDDLCGVTADAIREGGGFGWVAPPPRDVMERFWRGIVMVPGRTLFLGRLDGVVCGSLQLVRPPGNNEAQAFAASLTTCFVAPWARGHRVGRGMVAAAEALAREEGFKLLNLDVRATQTAAIALYRSAGFRQWGENPYYAMVGGRTVAGLYFHKPLVPELGEPS